MKAIFSRSAGFTLIELMIVVIIISALAAMGFNTYTSVQKKARDSKSKADLKGIQNSLEQYYSVCNNQYPTPTGSGPVRYIAIFCPNPTIGMMPTVPVNPKSTPYTCTSCTSTDYKLCTTLEAETGQFCVSNQQ